MVGLMDGVLPACWDVRRIDEGRSSLPVVRASLA
jgi:hypothetical protein